MNKEMSTRPKRREENFGRSFALTQAHPDVYAQPRNALEVAFKASDSRTTFERMCDSFKQTFLSRKHDEQHNFMKKNKAKLSDVLNNYRTRRIEYIDSETEANNAPVNLDRQLPSAKLAQLRIAKGATPPWAALIPVECDDEATEARSDSSGGDVELSPENDEQVFPRMLKYLSFVGAPFMFSGRTHDVQDDMPGDNAAMPLPAEVFGNPLMQAIRALPPINVRPRTLPARRSREEKVKEGDNPGKCPICLVEIEPGCTVIYLGCEHVYHKECITRWLEEKTTCPVCRKHASVPT